ncbi:hypothetical protein WAF17_22440 (plasmid) [Bernardetia sp. ABR2-2B]|uniref:hypothetical protein n=1 Tax=Bernardetia sp. ABR2-2B TaxID=3127472 RepID=UPI0030CD9D33
MMHGTHYLIKTTWIDNKSGIKKTMNDYVIMNGTTKEQLRIDIGLSEIYRENAKKLFEHDNITLIECIIDEK